MELNVRQAGNVEVLHIKGRLDLAGSESAEKFFIDYRMSMKPGLRLCVNFHDVEYVSSSGLRVLIAAFKEVQQKGGEMSLCEMNVAVEDVFRFAGLDTVFRIFPNEAQAIEALASANA